MLILEGPPPDRRLRRYSQLVAGLCLYGFADGLLLRAALGVSPWDVLHQGLSRTLGLQVGDWTIIVGAVVLVAWIPLRQRPGMGTIANIFIIGVGVNLTLMAVPEPRDMFVRVALLCGSVVGIGVATGLYIGSSLGPGPRDGLMTGIAARGHSIRVVRTGLEFAVLAAGWALGGNVGVGTLLFAVSIGPLAHLTLPAFRVASVRPVHA